MKFLLSLAAALAVAFPAWSAPALWRVRDADTEIVMFGSMHALPKGAPWRTRALDEAIAGADEVWFEFPSPTAPGMPEAYAKAYAALPTLEGKLSERLSPAARAKALEVFGSVEAIDSQRPSALIQTLAERYWAGMQSTLEQGVEAQVQAVVPVERQRAFGTPEQHLALTVGAPLEDQVRELELYLLGHHDVRPLLKSTDAWLAGDVEALNREAVERIRRRSPADFERLVRHRNYAWTDEIVRMLDRPGRILIVVGAGHLAGPEGLPTLLRARGLRVEGP